jgi:hypothetical protein
MSLLILFVMVEGSSFVNRFDSWRKSDVISHVLVVFISVGSVLVLIEFGGPSQSRQLANYLDECRRSYVIPQLYSSWWRALLRQPLRRQGKSDVISHVQVVIVTAEGALVSIELG